MTDSFFAPAGHAPPTKDSGPTRIKEPQPLFLQDEPVVFLSCPKTLSCWFMLVVSLLAIPAVLMPVFVVREALPDLTQITRNLPCPGVAPPPPPDGASPVLLHDDERRKYVKAWEAYVSGVLTRPEGVQPGCVPMRFPADDPKMYRGVVVLMHGFSTCPQELAVLARPLTQHNFDVLIPLNPGHGNALRFVPDAPMWPAAYLWMVTSVALMSLLLCIVSCSPGCPAKNRCWDACSMLACILFWCALLALCLRGTGSAAAGAASCIQLEPFAFSCRGGAENHTNLPTSPDGYRLEVDRINAIVALAPGVKLLAGLSLGGTMAAYAGQAIEPTNGTALYARQLLIAPFLGFEALDTLLDLPGLLDGVTVDWGVGCDEERHLGRAGYCNMRVDHVRAARDFGRETLAGLVAPADATVQVLPVYKDALVSNEKVFDLSMSYGRQPITRIHGLHAECSSGGIRPADVVRPPAGRPRPPRYGRQLGENASECLLMPVLDGASYHSFLSAWNEPGVPKYWIEEMLCQFVDFLTTGQAIEISSSPPDAETNRPVCAQECTPDTCDFKCETDWNVTCKKHYGRLKPVPHPVPTVTLAAASISSSSFDAEGGPRKLLSLGHDPGASVYRLAM